MSAGRRVAFWLAAGPCLVAFAGFLLGFLASSFSIMSTLLGGYSDATLVEIDTRAGTCYYELAEAPGTWHEASCPPNAEPFQSVSVFVDGSASDLLDDDSLFEDEEETGTVYLSRTEAALETLYLIGATLVAGLIAYLLRAVARRIDERPTTLG